MFSKNLLNAFLYLRLLFHKSSKYGYNRFFFERQNKIKKICTALGKVFSSSNWTTKSSNSVIGTYITDKLDLDFIRSKYETGYTSWYNNFIRTYFKNLRISIMFIKYGNVSKFKKIFSTLFVIMPIILVILCTCTFLVHIKFITFSYARPLFATILTASYTMITLILYYVPVITSFITIIAAKVRLLVFPDPYTYLLSLFVRLFGDKNVRKKKNLETEKYLIFKKATYLAKTLTQFRALVYLENASINSCTTEFNPVLTHKATVTLNHQPQLSSIFLKYDLQKLEARDALISQNPSLSSPLLSELNSSKSTDLNFMTDRWLYKYSNIKPRLEHVLHKIASCKSFITQTKLNETLFSTNLWLKNLKFKDPEDTWKYNLMNFMDSCDRCEDDLTFSNSKTDLYNREKWEKNQKQLRYLQRTASFHYKRFYLTQAIQNNRYLRMPFLKGYTGFNFCQDVNLLDSTDDKLKLYSYKSTIYNKKQHVSDVHTVLKSTPLNTLETYLYDYVKNLNMVFDWTNNDSQLLFSGFFRSNWYRKHDQVIIEESSRAPLREDQQLLHWFIRSNSYETFEIDN